MAWFVGQSLLMIALAFLLGLLVGWLVWGRVRRGTGVDEAPVQRPVPTKPASPVAVVQEPTAVEPPVVAEPVDEAGTEQAAPAEVEADPPAQRKPTAEPAVAAAPVAAPEPDDDLQRIEGIGPRMAEALRRAGIRTYGQLADADEDAIRAALENAKLRFAPSLVTWARQARLLADGDEEAFADLTRRLVAGRDEGRA